MVGDGLNDAPCLVAAHISMSPANAADVSQVASDLIFQGKDLKPVLTSIRVAHTAIRLVKKNFALAILYNVCAVPFGDGRVCNAAYCCGRNVIKLISRHVKYT